MQLPALNTNTVIVAILLTAMAYGLIVGKHRLRILILSVYVGIVLAEQLTSVLAPRLSMLSTDQINGILLGLPILIFGLAGIAHKKTHDKGTFIANALVGLFTGALIVSSALRFMPTSEMSAVDNDSFLAMILQQYHLWILGLLPLVAVLFGFIKKSEKGSH